jgi:hypothetical protein
MSKKLCIPSRVGRYRAIQGNAARTGSALARWR